MSASPDYTVVSQVHVNEWNAALQEAVPGWKIQVHDSVTGTVVPVFVADTHYTVDGTRQLIEAALTPVRQIAALGQTPSGS